MKSAAPRQPEHEVSVVVRTIDCMLSVIIAPECVAKTVAYATRDEGGGMRFSFVIEWCAEYACTTAA